MILGMDHLALTCVELSSGTEFLQAVGFKLQFMQTGVPNALEKARFLSQFNADHSVAFLRGSSGVAIELVQHGTSYGPAVQNMSMPVIRGLPIEVEQSARNLESVLSVCRNAFDTVSLVPMRWPIFDADFLCHETGTRESPSLSALTVPVQDLAVAEMFWTNGLCAKKVSKDSEWCRLVVASPISKWSVDILLYRSALDERTFLDTPGFTCAAFISSNLAVDGANLLRHGAIDSSGIFNLTISNRPLRVEIFRGPNNEFVELLQFSQRADLRAT